MALMPCFRVFISCLGASNHHRTAAPASRSTAIANHPSFSLVLTPTLPALGVAVADAVDILDAVLPPALLDDPDVGVADVSIVLAAEVTGGIEVTETGPGPNIDTPLLAFAESADAGNVASADAVRGRLKM